MKLEINQQELDFLINSVVEELNEIEGAAAVIKAAINPAMVLPKGGIAEGVELFEDYIARHNLLIKLWRLDKDAIAAEAQHKISQRCTQEAKDAIEKLKTLTEVPNG